MYYPKYSESPAPYNRGRYIAAPALFLKNWPKYSPPRRSPKFGVRLRRVYPKGVSPSRKNKTPKPVPTGLIRHLGFGANQRFQMQLRKLEPILKKARNTGNKNEERKILAFINRLKLRKQGLHQQMRNIINSAQGYIY